MRKVCPQSSGALKGVLGENLYVVSEKDVFIHCCFALTLQPKSCDMNIIMWLISYLAWKEVYHIIIFICTAYLFIFCNANKLGKCISLLPRLSLHPELAV